MLRKMPLRIRFTLIASLFLLISCTVLTLLSNMSAGHMIEAVAVVPATGDLSTPMMQLEPASQAGEHYYRIFQQKTGVATFLIVLVGSIAAYFAAGYALKPIRILSKEVKRRNVNNLGEPLTLPQTSDEIQELTLAFNQMMMELQNSFLMQKQFSADAAHELRTPLAVMQAKLDVFSLEKSGSPEVNALVLSLNQQLVRLSKLIEDLLWFSNDFPLEQAETVPLYPLLCDVADELSELSQQKQIAVQIERTDDVVMGQDRLLEHVFYNLLENAIKYSPAKTSIQIHVCRSADELQIQVCDEGEGIPKEYRETIFQPFFRVDKSRSRTIGGNGLGLAVCKKILDRHHAKICVLPNRPRGSIFQITFPA